MTSRAQRVGAAGRSVARDRVARGAAGSAALNISTTALNFAITVVLTNALGASGYGDYAFALAWSTTLSVPATLGLAPLIVRDISRYVVEADWGRLRGMIRHSHRLALGASAATVAVAAGVGAIALRHNPHLRDPFLIALALVPLVGLTTMRQSTIQALGRVVVGRIPETLLAPAGFLALAVGGVILFGHRFTATWAMAAQVISGLVAFAVGLWLLLRVTPTQVRGAAPVYERRAWRVSAGWLTVASIAGAVSGQVAVIMLGALDTSAAAGVYQAALRAALFVSFLFMAAGYSVGPAIARLRAENRPQELETLLRRSARVLFAGAVPVAVGLAIFAPVVLRIFGGDFRSGDTVLRILVLGELVRVGTGFAAPALVTGGFERDVATFTVIGAALAVVLTAALIPPLGAPGAAIAAVAALSATQIAGPVLVRRRLGLSCTVLPRRRGRAVGEGG